MHVFDLPQIPELWESVQGNNGRLYMPDGSEILQVPGGWCLKDAVDHTLATRQFNQISSVTSSSSMVKDLPLHITVGILSTRYLSTSAILDIDPSTFILTGVDSDMEIGPISVIADTDFQPYIAQAWASFQVDKASKDKGKCIRFDGVQVPPHRKLNA